MRATPRGCDILPSFYIMEREKRKVTIFAVSDIHGCATALIKSLDEAGFDRRNPNHLLIVLGDLFDRGGENRVVLEYLNTVKNKILIRGNHEDILMDSLTSGRVGHLQQINGTLTTLAEFFTYYNGEAYLDIVESSGRRVAEMLRTHVDKMYDYFETENYIFVHGWITEDAGENNFRYATEAKWHRARWDRWHNRYPNFDIPGGKTLVVGHTPCYYGSMFDKSRSDYDCSIFYGDRLVAIDGAAVSRGAVNVFVTEDEIYVPTTHTLNVTDTEMREFSRGGVFCLLLPFTGDATDIRIGDKLSLGTPDGSRLTFTVTATRLCADADTLDNERFHYDACLPSPTADAALTALGEGIPPLLLVIS